MLKGKRKGASGAKVLILVVIYFVVFAGFLMYRSSVNKKSVVDIKTVKDLEYIYENDLYGRIEVEPFTYLDTTVTRIIKDGDSDKLTTNRLYATPFQDIYLYNFTSGQEYLDKSVSDSEAFIKVSKAEDHRYQSSPKYLVQGDYIVGYYKQLGLLIIDGGIFFAVSAVIIAVFAKALIKKK